MAWREVGISSRVHGAHLISLVQKGDVMCDQNPGLAWRVNREWRLSVRIKIEERSDHSMQK